MRGDVAVVRAGSSGLLAACPLPDCFEGLIVRAGTVPWRGLAGNAAGGRLGLGCGVWPGPM